MNSVLFDLGFLQIKWYSFFILIAIITAYFIIYRELKKKDIKEDDFINIVFYGIIIGILGARIYYVLFNLNYYLANPIEIIKIWRVACNINIFDSIYEKNAYEFIVNPRHYSCWIDNCTGNRQMG